MYTSRLLFLLFVCSSNFYSTQQSPLKVVLYFEALCPYCHEFIVEQLYPGYLTLGDSIEVDLVSFGKASSNKTNNGIEWTCQHGPAECYQNKIDACVINSNASQSQILRFINCTTAQSSMSSTQEQLEDVSKGCAMESNLSWYEIQSCFLGGRGDDLLLAYEKRQQQLNPKIEYVPNIRFNDVADTDLELKARMDFVWTCCSLFTENKPSACDNI